MRIAFITYEFPPETGKGGIGTYSKQVASMLANGGWDVHVFAGSPNESRLLNIDRYTLHYVQCADGFDFRKKVVPIFGKQHEEKPFDLMESPEINSNAWEIKRAFPLIPLVVRLHAPNWLVEKLKKKYVPFFAKLRFVLGALRRGKWDAGYWRTYHFREDTDYQFTVLANEIAAPSKIMKTWAIDCWKINADKITVLSNPFNPPKVFVSLPIEKNLVHKEILFFGRLNVLKGMVNGTIAMKKILKNFPEYRFKVIGDDGVGPSGNTGMKKWMHNTFSELIERVIFEEGLPYEKLALSISNASIVLLPSLFESFSYTCAEAMAAGKAVVGSRNTGMADMIDDGKTGLLVNPYNADAIYEALKLLITDNDYRYKLALGARKAICTKYNTELLLEEYQTFYKNVMKRNE